MTNPSPHSTDKVFCDSCLNNKCWESTVFTNEVCVCPCHKPKSPKKEIIDRTMNQILESRDVSSKTIFAPIHTVEDMVITNKCKAAYQHGKNAAKKEFSALLSSLQDRLRAEKKKELHRDDEWGIGFTTGSNEALDTAIKLIEEAKGYNKRI